MKDIKKTLERIKDDLKVLLDDMYPNLKESIALAHKEHFKEWFAMLFEINKWHLEGRLICVDKLILVDKLENKAKEELEDYQLMEDLSWISAIEQSKELFLLDGYHRVLLAKERDLKELKGVVWRKEPNFHKNCTLIKNLIFNNL
jgi:hypothetical protein